MPYESVSIKKSTNPKKKYMAVFTSKDRRSKTTHFGSAGMDDYTKTKDKEQRARYLNRHRKNEDWNKYYSAGSLSRYISWGDSTSMRTNIASFKRKFNLR